jgi:uncharacterized protein YjiS (DUF1127 family)
MELVMTICTVNDMRNSYNSDRRASGVFRLFSTFQIWRQRSRDRIELASKSERELNDFGLSLGEAIYEAEKPFWRA